PAIASGHGVRPQLLEHGEGIATQLELLRVEGLSYQNALPLEEHVAGGILRHEIARQQPSALRGVGCVVERSDDDDASLPVCVSCIEPIEEVPAIRQELRP